MTSVANFGIIYTPALKKAPNPSAKLVYSALATFADAKSREAFPKHDTIADMLGISERTVRRAISDLKDAELIEIVGTKRSRNGYKSANVYRLLDSHRPPVSSKNEDADDSYRSPMSSENDDDAISPATHDQPHRSPMAGQEQTIEHTNTNNYITTTSFNNDSVDIAHEKPKVKPRPKMKVKKLGKAGLRKLGNGSLSASSSSSARTYIANGIDVIEFIEEHEGCTLSDIFSNPSFKNTKDDIEYILGHLELKNRITKNGDTYSVR